MSARTRVAIVAVAVASGFAAGSFTTTGASNPAPTVSALTVAAGDTYMKIAQRIAPGASTTQIGVLAHSLARRNGGSDTTPITSVLQADNILFYLPADIPTPAASTTTTTTLATTTSSSVPSSTAPATTSTTSTSVPATGGSPACGLASAAFCETFDAPHNGGTQTGDLDPTLWGVSRLGSIYPSGGGLAATKSNPCGNGSAVYAPADVRVCGGQLVESNNDGGTVTSTDIYPKQPFDFAGRTGTVVFDVSSDSEGIHAAWPEFAITDTPIPGTRRAISEGSPGASPAPQHAQNAIGFSLAGCGGSPFTTTGIDTVYYVSNGNYVAANNNMGARQCVTAGKRTSMNHIKVMVSGSRIQVFGTDAGGTTLKLLADESVPLTFTRGLVWMNDAHYNAAKNHLFTSNGGKQQDHAFAWDNLGFDGPKTYRDLGFDVPLARQSACANSEDGFVLECEAYNVTSTRTFTVTGVNFGAGTTSARIVLNARTEQSASAVSVSINGHTPVALTPGTLGYGYDSLTALLPKTDAVAGTNTITMTVNGSMEIANLSLIMVAAAPVP